MRRTRAWIIVAVLTVSCSDVDEAATERFRADFAACMADRGVQLQTLDAEVTRDRRLQMRGLSYTGEEDPGDPAAACENLLLRRHGLTPD